MGYLLIGLGILLCWIPSWITIVSGVILFMAGWFVQAGIEIRKENEEEKEHRRIYGLDKD